MKRTNLIALITALAVVLSAVAVDRLFFVQEDRFIKAGFVYVGDGANPYTSNFLNAQHEIEEKYGSRVECVPKYNITEGLEANYIQELIDEDCDIIFGASYGYAKTMKEYAADNPDVIFCMATGDNINDGQVLDNYYTFMGHIYEGRYIAGVIAGMKINEMINAGRIKPENAVIGYVAAYPYPEVISGYTAFLLGARSVCPDATMKVRYVNTWSGYAIEKKVAEQFIREGCVIISQHSDTKGPAVACEEVSGRIPVYHVSYNQSMKSVAPTTSLTGCRVNWNVFEDAAIDALLKDIPIEKNMSPTVTINGLDMGAGIEDGWVELLELNETIIPRGTHEAIKDCINQFKAGTLEVFKGPYTGTDPFNPEDTIDLSLGYRENEVSSAPGFHYVLDDIIEILE